jgi:hypothetical protein
MALAVEYRRIGQLPTCIGNERIRIAVNGRVDHSRNTAECDPGVQWSTPWRAVGRIDDAAMAQLQRQIIETGVLSLAAEATADSVEGGRREELDLTVDGRERHIVLQNTESPAFRAAVQLLWGVMFSLER